MLPSVNELAVKCEELFNPNHEWIFLSEGEKMNWVKKATSIHELMKEKIR